MHSKIYRGEVMHQRPGRGGYRFGYRVFMLYLDLDELPGLFDRFWLWSARRANIASFRRRDHFGGEKNLKQEVLNQVEASLQMRPSGAVRLLTNLRYFGFIINPLSLYYCFDQGSEAPVAVVAEVHNTPWGERHTYVLDLRSDTDDQHHGTASAEHDKTFHVSPFLPMDLRYRWRLSQPLEKLLVHIECWQQNRIFTASLNLRREDISHSSMARVLLDFPIMTLKVAALIYFQAVKLWLRGTRFYPHPSKGK